jgi:isocitrate lyase
MYQLASGYAERQMSAYVELQEAEFASATEGYTAARHQHEVGVSYFDQVSITLSGGMASTLAFEGSTEEEQFETGAEQIPVYG